MEYKFDTTEELQEAMIHLYDGKDESDFNNMVISIKQHGTNYTKYTHCDKMVEYSKRSTEEFLKFINRLPGENSL